MLDQIYRKLRRPARKSFDERYVDYLIEVHDTNLVLEMDYIKRHNRLDVFKLNKLIAREFDEAIR